MENKTNLEQEIALLQIKIAEQHTDLVALEAQLAEREAELDRLDVILHARNAQLDAAVRKTLREDTLAALRKFVSVSITEYRNRLETRVDRIVEYADRPDSPEFRHAVEQHREYDRAVEELTVLNESLLEIHRQYLKEKYA